VADALKWRPHVYLLTRALLQIIKFRNGIPYRRQLNVDYSYVAVEDVMTTSFYLLNIAIGGDFFQEALYFLH
jgi:hypothetical protein